MKKVSQEFLFIATTLTCAFIYNPLALIFPYGSKLSSYVFFFDVPHLFIVSSLSLVYCFLNIQLIDFKNTAVRLCLAAVGISILSSTIFGSHFQATLESLALFCVPLAISLAAQKTPQIEKLILPTLSFLWFLSMFYCVIWPGNQKIGFSGNQNWLAATLLSSAIFTTAWLRKILPSKYFKIVVFAFIPLNLYILNLCQARVLYPVFGALLLYSCWSCLPRKANYAIWVFCLISFFSILFLKQDYVQRSLNLDIRGPLYKDSISMILTSPFFGHGAGHFQRDFPEFASDALKQKIVYSPIVEHPHNEFLHLASENGLIVALLWLGLLLITFKKSSNTNYLFYQFIIISLFIMGMADKPLVISSSAILFLIAVGLNLQVPLKVTQSQNHSLIRIIPAAAVIALLIFRLSQILPSQYYKWQGEQAKNAFQKTGKQKLAPIVLDLYKKSAASDPQAIYPQYVYSSLLTRFSNNFQDIAENLKKTASLEPYFSDLNFHLGQFYQRQSSLVPAKDRQDYLNLAEEHFKMNLKSSPWSIKRNRQLFFFYSQYSMLPKALSSLAQLRKVSRQKLQTLYTYPGRGDLKQELQEARQAAINTPINFARFTSSLKGGTAKSYLYNNISNKYPNYHQYTSPNFFDHDWLFWHEMIKLNEEVKGIQTPLELVKAVVTKEIKKEQALLAPYQAWKAPKTSPKSLSGLLTHIAYSKNWLACNYESKNELLTLILTDKHITIIDCQTGKLSKKKLTDLKGGIFRLLFQPEKFIIRHQLLSDLLSLDEEFPQLVKGPTEATLLLRQKLKGLQLSLDLSYFDLLLR
ncbi:MAG: O-antigen ligase family protein [Lentisphaerales bacterium]|nr:O-antigen ligase family protein [Lentisphaerales bacterium]